MNIIDNIKGNVITINVLNNTLIGKLNKSKDIQNLVCLNEIKKGKKKFKKSDSLSKINISKLYLTFDKKSVDYAIVDVTNLAKYYKTLIKNFNIIVNKKAYIYGNIPEYKFKHYMNIAKRYNIEVSKINDYYILSFDKVKKLYFSEIGYSIYDFFYTLNDYIGTALMQ